MTHGSGHEPATAPQGEQFATYRHHGFITNSTLGTVEGVCCTIG